MKEHSDNKLVAVFGSGGDRDTTKRIIMGQVGAKYADKIVVTDDNPRTENPAKIRDMVIEGCPGAENIGHRPDAIKRAVELLEEGDILLLLGKGSEKYIIYGEEKRPYSEYDVVRDAVITRFGKDAVKEV